MKTKTPLLLLFVLFVTFSGQSQAMGHHHHLEMMRQPLELKDFSTDGCSADKDLVIEKFDSILHTLIDVKDWMTPRQRAFVLARYELLRHEAFEGKTREHEKETYDDRLHLIRDLLE